MPGCSAHLCTASSVGAEQIDRFRYASWIRTGQTARLSIHDKLEDPARVCQCDNRFGCRCSFHRDIPYGVLIHGQISTCSGVVDVIGDLRKGMEAEIQRYAVLKLKA